MSNFKIPDLCGASPELNLASSKIADLESQITSQINAEASAAKAAIESKLTDVKLGLDGLVPDLPELPNLNFQSELTSLISFDISTPQGLTQYTSKLNDLKLKFGDTLTKSGKDFDSLVSSATDAISGGGNVCGVVPNLELPAAGGEVLEKAEGVKAALENAIDEEVSTVSDNVNATALKAELESTTASYADKTTYEITEKSTKITTPAGTKVSAIIGLDNLIAEDRLKALGAGAASTGSVGLFHIVGQTPEAPTLDAICLDIPNTQTLTPTAQELRLERDLLSHSSSDELDCIAVGSPHFSYPETIALLDALQERKSIIPFYVCTNRFVLTKLEHEKLLIPLNTRTPSFQSFILYLLLHSSIKP